MKDRRITRIARGSAIGALVLLIVFGAFIQSSRGTLWILRSAFRAASGYADATVEADAVRGTRVTSLEIVGLRIRSGDSLDAAIDTLRIRHRFAPLLRRSLVIRDLAVVAPSVDLTGCLPPAPASTWTLEVERGTLRRGSLRRIECDPASAPWSLESLDLDVTDVLVGATYAGRVDGLEAVLRPPGAPDGYTADVSLSLELADGRLSVPSLTLDSPASNVSGGGVLRLARDLSEFSDVDFELLAAPVALRDVAPFVRGLADEGLVSLDVRLTGSSRILDVSAEMAVAETDAAETDPAEIDDAGGGSVALDAAFTTIEDGEVEYRGTLRSRAFDASRVLAAAPPGPIDGELDFDLSGPSRSDLSGRIDFTGRQRDPASGEAVTATLSALFAQGRGELEGSVEVASARAAFQGWTRPFAPSRELSLTGDFEWSTSRPVDSSATRFGGAFSIALSGETLAGASGEGSVDLTSSFVNRAMIPEATLTWNLDQGAGPWQLSGLVGTGSVVGTGGIDLRDATVIRLESGRVQNVDLAALLGDSASSEANGTLSGTGRLAVGAPISLDGQIDLGRSWYGPYEVDSTAVQVDLREGRVEADAAVQLLGGSAELAVEGTLDDAWRVAVTQGRFRGIDLAAPGASERFMTDLTGSLTGEVASGRGGSGRDAAGTGDSRRNGPAWRGWVGRLGLSLEPSLINELSVDTGTLEATLREGSLTYSGEISYPSGRLSLEGDGRPADSLPTWRVSSARFTNLDVSALLARSGPALPLSGRLDGSIRGADRRDLSGTISMSLTPSQIGGRTLRAATVGGLIEQSRFAGTVEAEIDGAAARLDATLDFGGSVLRYRAQGSVDVTELAQALQSESMAGAIAGTFDVEGEGVDPDAVLLSGVLRLGAGEIRGLAVDSAHVVGRLASGRVTFDTLGVWGPELSARGAGALAFAATAGEQTDLTILATLDGAEPLRSLLGRNVTGLGRGDLEVSLTGPANALRIRAEATGSGLSFAGVFVGRFESSGEASLDDQRRVVDLDSRASADSLRWRDLLVEAAQFSAVSRGDEYDVSADFLVDGRRTGRFAAGVAMDQTGTDVRLTELTLQLQQERWALESEALVRVEDGFEVTDFLLSSASGRVGVNGSIHPLGEQSLRIDAEDVRFGALADLLGYEAFSGELDASIGVTGSASSPAVSGIVSGEVAILEGLPRQLDAEFRYDNLRMDAEGSIREASGQEIRFGAGLPFLFTLAPADSIERRWAILDDEPLALDVSANGFQLDWLAPFLDEQSLREPRGTLDADVRVRGSRSEPVLAGSVELIDGAVYAPDLGVRFEGAGLSARLQGQRVIIDRGGLRSGGGVLEMTGEIGARSLTLADLDLELALDDFEAMRSEFIRATVDGQLTLGGTTGEPRIAGTVDILRGDLFPAGRLTNGGAELVELTDADYAMLEERFGYRPSARDLRTSGWFEPLGLAIDLRFGRDTWVRQPAGPGLSIQLAGELQVTKEPYEMLSMVGTLDAVPSRSYVEQFGRRFRLTQGNVVFGGDLREAQIDIETAYAVPSKQNPDAPELVINLGLEGGIDDLRLILSSEPVVENADIVSYLATGRPASQTLQTSGGFFERGTNLALDRVTGVVEGFAADNVGLDVVEIQTDGVNGATLISGRYVAPRLYLGFKQPVSVRRGEQSGTGRTRTPEIEIEYEAYRWLLLNLQRGGSRIEFFLRSRYAY